ncbi:hypothetical protein ACQKQD_32065 [Methylobacterium sp. NPDC080182]|uniref:hypothetical protein n=1 Tax=Methylobacterium sp. NPDC080182 TaxID=3390590 RepID=UPI003D0524F1
MDTITVPTVEDFMRDPTQRRGYLACLAVYHVADYLKPAGSYAPTDIRAKMEAELGRPFVALWHMADAVKHREKTGKGGVVLMEAGSDSQRPATGFDMGSPDNPWRFDDGGGGRWIPGEGCRYDMLDLCVMVLRAYARLYHAELAGSLIDGIRYNPATYAP